AGPHLGGVGGDAVHHPVGVVGVVVEQYQLLGICLRRQADAFLPARMPPVLVRGIFVVGIGAVVDGDVNAVHQLQHVRVELALTVLGVGDVGERLATEF